MDKKRGFTLIEIIVIIVVIGVLAGIGYGAFRNMFERTLLEEQRSRIYSFYHLTTRVATTKGRNYRLVVDRSDNRLRNMRDTTVTSVRDSLPFRTRFDLRHGGGNDQLTFIITPEGNAVDADDIRNFVLYDNETGDSLVFYISPLGIIETE